MSEREALLFYQLGALHGEIRRALESAQKIKAVELGPMVKQLAECESYLMETANKRAQSAPADETQTAGNEGEWWNDRRRKEGANR